MGCLSRMRGNLHVRFLGEGVAARPPPYPPRAVGSIPIARSTSNTSRLLICSRKANLQRLAFSFSGRIQGEPDKLCG